MSFFTRSGKKLVPNGSGKSRIIFCRDEGCANETKSVFCGDVNLLKANLEPCKGPPRSKEVCEQESRAYVNTTEKSCDFERVGEHEQPHLLTSECTDQIPCNWSDVTASPPPLYNNNGTYIGAGGGNATNGTGEMSPGYQALYSFLGIAGILVILFIIHWLLTKCTSTKWICWRKQNETNGIPMPVVKGNSGTTSETGEVEYVYTPDPHSSGA